MESHEMNGGAEEPQKPITNVNIDYFLKEGFYVGLTTCLNCDNKWICVLPPEAKRVCRNVECPSCNSRGNKFRHITFKNKSRVLKNFKV
jgi:hypothetical protein